MSKKIVSFAMLASVMLWVSCNNTSTSKITDEDLKAFQAEKELASKLPKVALNKTEHDFGTINEGDVVETEFLVKNTGEADLIIASAKGSCGCTVPVWPKEPIKPGEEAPIQVSFNSSGKPGQQSKTVTLTTNTEMGNETFSIKANVNPKNK